jgi:hypothetical protein
MNNEFLKHILGEDGLIALNRVANKVPLLKPVIVPRAVMAWLSTVGKLGYEGELPGLPNSYFALIKNEDSYAGALTIEDKIYTFEDVDILHVAASVSVAVGIDSDPIADEIKTKDLSNLGKSIDLLVKHELIKQYQFTKSVNENEVEKIAKPLFKKQALDKPKVGKLLITKSEQSKKCEECGQAQFKNNRFEGCFCFKDLTKSINTINIGSNIYLKFKKDLDSDAVEALIAVLKG